MPENPSDVWMALSIMLRKNSSSRMRWTENRIMMTMRCSLISEGTKCMSLRRGG